MDSLRRIDMVRPGLRPDAATDMIKRILLGLTGTPYTEVAIRHANDLAQRFDASVTGIAILDKLAAASGRRRGRERSAPPCASAGAASCARPPGRERSTTTRCGPR
jgi:nucleotide-binding universal stress UspA family protein